MGSYHDSNATLCGNAILQGIRASDGKYKQIFSASISRIGEWDWPRPDYVCYDEGIKATYALEFKPPFQSKREYLTGLGQALSYLQKHTYSGLIVPYLADDGFHIAKYISRVLESPEFEKVPMSLFAYDPNDYSLETLRAITDLRTGVVAATRIDNESRTYWCWWRDLSQYELYDLLRLSFSHADEPGDIYTDRIYPEFYRMMIDKKTKQWDGTPRNKRLSKASFRAEKQNCKIPLVQLDLWTSSEGRLTDKGFELLQIGKKYGPGSQVFLDELAYAILVDGRHLDLISMVNDCQDTIAVPGTSREYAIALEKYLSDNGSIGRRKPTAVTTGAKNSYMRDEMKLWNKLQLLSTNSIGYFYRNQGYKFNWDRITKLLVNAR